MSLSFIVPKNSATSIEKRTNFRSCVWLWSFLWFARAFWRWLDGEKARRWRFSGYYYSSKAKKKRNLPAPPPSGSATFAQLHRKFNLIFSPAGCFYTAFVPFRNAARHGKSNPKAARCTGRICPIKTIKKPICLLLRYILATVYSAQNGALFPFLQRYTNGGSFCCVFYGIIQQDGDQLSYGILFPSGLPVRSGIPTMFAEPRVPLFPKGIY